MNNGLTKGQNTLIITCLVLSLSGAIIGFCFFDKVIASIIFATGLIVTFINGVYYDISNRKREIKA